MYGGNSKPYHTRGSIFDTHFRQFCYQLAGNSDISFITILLHRVDGNLKWNEFKGQSTFFVRKGFKQNTISSTIMTFLRKIPAYMKLYKLFH